MSRRKALGWTCAHRASSAHPCFSMHSATVFVIEGLRWCWISTATRPPWMHCKLYLNFKYMYLEFKYMYLEFKYFVCCRQTRGAWPILMKLGNFSHNTCDKAAAKRFITLMEFPERRETDNEEDFRFCFSSLYLRVWDAILRLIKNWEGGFWLKTLPLTEDSEWKILVPRVGLILGDLLEMRLIAATNSAWSVRCATRLSEKPDAEVEAEEAAAAAESGADSSSEPDILGLVEDEGDSVEGEAAPFGGLSPVDVDDADGEDEAPTEAAIAARFRLAVQVCTWNSSTCTWISSTLLFLWCSVSSGHRNPARSCLRSSDPHH